MQTNNQIIFNYLKYKLKQTVLIRLQKSIKYKLMLTDNVTTEWSMTKIMIDILSTHWIIITSNFICKNVKSAMFYITNLINVGLSSATVWQFG